MKEYWRDPGANFVSGSTIKLNLRSRGYREGLDEGWVVEDRRLGIT